MKPVRLVPALLVSALLVLAAACGGDDESGGGDGPPPGGGSGAEIYGQNCATCHGQDGEGGIGPELGGGAVAEAYPDVEDQIAIITNGRAGMPAWRDQLTPEQIRAVAMFEREGLGQGE